jgi:hypothetical protein
LVAPSTWATVLALVFPACAVALPRQFGVSVLISWIGFGAASFVYYGLLIDELRRRQARTR